MDEMEKQEPEQQEAQQPAPEQEKDVYVPRPAWQVWLARIGVVVVAVAFILYLIQIATGGGI